MRIVFNAKYVPTYEYVPTIKYAYNPSNKNVLWKYLESTLISKQKHLAKYLAKVLCKVLQILSFFRYFEVKALSKYFS